MKFFRKWSLLGGLFWTKRGFLPMESVKNLQILIFSHVHNIFPLTFCFLHMLCKNISQLTTAVFATFFSNSFF
jgi:hypothetical protein